MNANHLIFNRISTLWESINSDIFAPRLKHFLSQLDTHPIHFLSQPDTHPPTSKENLTYEPSRLVAVQDTITCRETSGKVKD